MEERRYRESRICRTLGNPTVYRIIVLLANRGPLTPSEIAGLTRRKISTVSGHLARLRTADLVRYETRGKRVRYWLKHAGGTRAVLGALGRLVRRAAAL